MNPHLPTPFPDELGYSVLCRHADAWHHCEDLGLWQAWTGGEANHRQLVEVVAGCRNLAPHAYPLVSDPQRHFVRNHTLLPYFAAFMNSSVRGLAISGLQSSRPSASASLACQGRRPEAPQRLRFCPDCYEQQLRRGGFAYWTRTAQLPGLSACPAHGSFLLRTDIGVEMRTERDRLRPLDRSVTTLKQAPSRPLMSRRLESRVAIHSLAALRGGLGQRDATSVGYYRRQLFSAGYGNRRGELRASAFIDDFCRWLNRFKAKPDEFGPPNWWLRLVTRIGGPTHPVQHILMREFIAAARREYDEVQPSFPEVAVLDEPSGDLMHRWEPGAQEP